MGGIFSRAGIDESDHGDVSPDAMAHYLETYPFTKIEIHILRNKFKTMCKRGSNTISRDDLDAIEEMKANPFATRIMELFSEDGSGMLDFGKFVNLVTVFSEFAPVEVKLIWAFAIWDFDGDDVIGDEDIKMGISIITSTVDKLINDDIFTTSSKVTLSEEEVDAIACKVQEEVDPDHYGLTYPDFRRVLVRMPDFFQNFRMNFVSWK